MSVYRLNLMTAILIAVCVIGSPSSADDDHHNKRNRHGRNNTMTANNEAYQQACGDCHLAYPPGLLPSGSWDRLISELPSHFGEELQLDQETTRTIAGFLKSRSAEQSLNKRSRKILRSLDGETPLRITETPYIRGKHHDLGPDILGRRAIGSLANCNACHPMAAQGKFDDDHVTIPD